MAPRVLPRGTPKEKCDYHRLRNQLSFVREAPIFSSAQSAARHASLIRSWHNDRASRVAGSESSSVLQPATTRILPRRPALFIKFPVTYELARSRMKHNRAGHLRFVRILIGFRDAGYFSPSLRFLLEHLWTLLDRKSVV